MAAIYITGDIHASPQRLSTKLFFPQIDMENKDENFVIICGDFGLVWNYEKESGREKYWLDWLENKNFTTLFVSGNHENFDRLKTYKIEDWNGGKVQRIRPHVIHLMRGEIYNILGKTFFTFGGASSHDIQDGILEPHEREKIKTWSKDWTKMFRINHFSWWKEELASEEEMSYGKENLEKVKQVDYIITHCLPQSIASVVAAQTGNGTYNADVMTLYFDEIAKSTNFTKWFAGHYHTNMSIGPKFQVLYEDIACIYEK